VARETASRDAGPLSSDDYPAVSQQILRYATRGAPRIEFLTEISAIVLRFLGCDALAIEVRDSDLHYRWSFADGAAPKFTIVGGSNSEHETGPPNSYRSTAAVEFTCNDHPSGILEAKSAKRNYFNRARLDRVALIGQTVGLAIASRRAQWALRERVKELTCLYGIGRIAQHANLSLEEALRSIAALLPPAWQFPEIARGRIVLDGATCATPDFHEGLHRQSAAIIVNGQSRGVVEVAYTETRGEFAEGPFLREEWSLIETVAREVALIVEQREAEEYRARLQTQLRHADRLATIGQLAAGVAHELNEPLGSILGFAQLAQKHPGLPDAPARDLQHIVKSCLHARDVIHKLLLFSRQKAPMKARVNINRLVEEGLFFLESRCAKAGVSITRTLAPDLAEIEADPSQLHQVLVNLVVNGIQAMPEGGSLTIGTRAGGDSIFLSVADTGIGMTQETQARIFTPFFTTKDVDQGTGLGLAVVHGIVTAHGGTIRVESAPGRGSRFEVSLPRHQAAMEANSE
jgi:signal transduction histidine kinase